MNSIALKGISKQFGDTIALKDISLYFEENKIYGLLGRNGAGKSTMLNIIANRLFADSGEVTVNGLAAAENDQAQQLIYLMSEQTLYPESMKRYGKYSSGQRIFIPILIWPMPRIWRPSSAWTLRKRSAPFQPATDRSLRSLSPFPSIRLMCCWTNRFWGWTPTIGICSTSFSLRNTAKVPALLSSRPT